MKCVPTLPPDQPDLLVLMLPGQSVHLIECGQVAPGGFTPTVLQPYAMSFEPIH